MSVYAEGDARASCLPRECFHEISALDSLSAEVLAVIRGLV
jgi:hypothetical protein